VGGWGVGAPGAGCKLQALVNKIKIKLVILKNLLILHSLGVTSPVRFAKGAFQLITLRRLFCSRFDALLAKS